jgi:hypothetical protein
MLTRHKNVFAVCTLLIAFALGFGTSSLMAGAHPDLQAAQTALTSAMEHLRKASEDFGGHRSRAMEHVHQAQEELKDAMHY